MSQTEAEAPPVESTGPVGRLVRLVMAAGLFLALAWPLSRVVTFPDPQTARDPMLYIMTAISVLLVPYILDLGLAWGGGRRAQILLVALAGPLAGVDLILWGRLWAPALAFPVLVLLSVVFATMALAYLLAAILGTPGCELRAFAHLASKISDRTPEPAFCPAGLDALDAWEAGR